VGCNFNCTPCPDKKGTTSFSTIILAFINPFLLVAQEETAMQTKESNVIYLIADDVITVTLRKSSSLTLVHMLKLTILNFKKKLIKTNKNVNIFCQKIAKRIV